MVASHYNRLRRRVFFEFKGNFWDSESGMLPPTNVAGIDCRPLELKPQPFACRPVAQLVRAPP